MVPLRRSKTRSLWQPFPVLGRQEDAYRGAISEGPSCVSGRDARARKMLAFSVPPGERRTAPLDGFTGLIAQELKAAVGQRRKQRPTAKRLFERLRAEHGFTGGYTIVKDAGRAHRRRRREMFVPPVHPSGHVQADFREARAVIGGVEQPLHDVAFDRPHGGASYVRAYPVATAEAWVETGPRVFVAGVGPAVDAVRQRPLPGVAGRA